MEGGGPKNSHRARTLTALRTREGEGNVGKEGKGRQGGGGNF